MSRFKRSYGVKHQAGQHIGSARLVRLTATAIDGDRRRSVSVRTSCTGSRRPRGAARAADSGRRGRAPAPLPLGRPLAPGRLARKARTWGSGNPGSHGAAADLTRGPLAAAPSGLCGRPGKAARSRASVQPPPPCQIRRSVNVDSTLSRSSDLREPATLSRRKLTPCGRRARGTEGRFWLTSRWSECGVEGWHGCGVRR